MCLVDVHVHVASRTSGRSGQMNVPCASRPDENLVPTNLGMIGQKP